MVVGPNTISDGPHSVRFGDIKDGASNTIMFVEIRIAASNGPNRAILIMQA